MQQPDLFEYLPNSFATVRAGSCNDFGNKYFWHQQIDMFAGPPLVVEINMQVRSMGPISEVDMVSV